MRKLAFRGSYACSWVLVLVFTWLPGCSGSSCNPPDFLVLDVVDGETGAALPDATVQVNGVTLPYGVEDQDICAHVAASCTHGMGHRVPLDDFDREALSIVVMMAGYEAGVFDFAPQEKGKTIYLVLEIWKAGTGTAKIRQSGYLVPGQGSCS